MWYISSFKLNRCDGQNKSRKIVIWTWCPSFVRIACLSSDMATSNFLINSQSSAEIIWPLKSMKLTNDKREVSSTKGNLTKCINYSHSFSPAFYIVLICPIDRLKQYINSQEPTKVHHVSLICGEFAGLNNKGGLMVGAHW